MALGKRKPFNTKHRKRRILWQRVGFVAVALILVCGAYPLVFYGVRLPMATITNVVVLGTETISKEEVQTRAEVFLRGSYFGFIPHRFTFLLPTKKIRESLLEMPRVANAVFTTENHALIITVVEHAPDMLWCANATATSTCFYVEKNGHAYEKAPILSVCAK